MSVLAGIMIALIVFFVLASIFLRPKPSNGIEKSNSGEKGIISERLKKISSKNIVFWIFFILFTVSLLYGIFLEVGLVPVTPEHCYPENIEINGFNNVDRIFENGKDGNWRDLNQNEKDKYAVALFPKEGITVFYGGEKGENFLVYMGRVAYPGKIVAEQIDGFASNQFVLVDIEKGGYEFAHTGTTVKCDLGYGIFTAINFDLQRATISSEKKPFRTIPVGGSMEGNMHDIYAKFTIPANGYLSIKYMEVKD